MVKERSRSMTAKGKNHNIIIVGKAVDDIDNIMNLDEKSKGGVYHKALSSLQKSGFEHISQLRRLYTEYGEKYSIKKIKSLYKVGNDTSLWVLCKAMEYKYPKGYTPKIYDLPDWVVEEEKAYTGAVEETTNVISISSIVDNYNKEEIEDEESFNTSDDTEIIDIDKYAESIVEESELPGMVVDIIFDIFNDPNNHPELIKDGKQYKQYNVYYNKHNIFIEKEYLFDIFCNKIKDINITSNLDKKGMFIYALQNISGVYSYFSNKDRHKYYWGRKNLFPGNMRNYIEIPISTLESSYNKEINFPEQEEVDEFNLINQPADKSSAYFSFERKEKKEVLSERTKSNFHIMPIKCSNGEFYFKIVNLENKFDFDLTSDISSKRCLFVFDKDDIEDGELLTGRDISDADCKVIRKLAIEFLKG